METDFFHTVVMVGSIVIGIGMIYYGYVSDLKFQQQKGQKPTPPTGG